MSESGRVTYAGGDDFHVLRYHGRVTYPAAPAIKRFADGLLASTNVGEWIFDLSSAECLDSTNLGIVARIADLAQSRDRARVRILSSNDDITRVLRSMRFDQMFEVVTDLPAPTGTSPGSVIGTATGSPDELGQTMLDAHRMLMTLGEVPRLQFKEVVAQLEAELAQK